MYSAVCLHYKKSYIGADWKRESCREQAQLPPPAPKGE